jgi:hypothetical protein
VKLLVQSGALGLGGTIIWSSCLHKVSLTDTVVPSMEE